MMARQDSSARNYIVGFVLSLALTVAAYLLVVNHWLSGNALVAAFVACAVLQLYVQLVFFLHMGRGRSKLWSNIAFWFMVLVVLIVVVGSLWIMNNLNYHMEPAQVDSQVQKDEGIYR